jgi:hypothetical protein
MANYRELFIHGSNLHGFIFTSPLICHKNLNFNFMAYMIFP